MRSQIAIIGATYSGNKGAAGMLSALVDALSDKLINPDFKVFSLYPTKDLPLKQTSVTIVPLPAFAVIFVLPFLAFFYMLLGWIPIIAFLLKKYLPLKKLLHSDVLLDLSGISFVDGRAITLIYNVCCLLPAFFLNIPVVKMSQALGPFNDVVNRVVAKTILPRVHTIFSRGKFTSENLRQLEMSNWKPAADLAFLLKEKPSNLKVTSLLSTSYQFTIGVSPSQVLSSYCSKEKIEYIEPLANALNKFASVNNAQVIIIAHSNLGEDIVSRNNDYQICSKLYKLCNSDFTSIILDDISPSDLRLVISQCDVFIASRFHSMISALCTGTPTLVTSWSHKYQEVMDEFDVGYWILNTNEISETKLLNYLNSLFLDKENISEKISNNLPRVIDSAQTQIDYVLAMLRDRSNV
ncbi:MAG: polysaccharide pyruvyl transferase family protein [Candidatus Kariarchaeaceae archaeon]